MSAENQKSSPKEKGFQVLLCGESGAGKTSLVRRFVENAFSSSFAPTIGIDFAKEEVQLQDPYQGSTALLQIWDSAGQEKFRSIGRSFYRRAQAILLLLDVSHRSSLQDTRRWFAEISQNAPEDTLIFLVGNKVDLLPKLKQKHRKALRKRGAKAVGEGNRELEEDEDKPFISEDEVRALGKEHRVEEVWFTSAKTGHDVRGLFYKVAFLLHKATLDPEIGEKPPEDAGHDMVELLETNMSLDSLPPHRKGCQC